MNAYSNQKVIVLALLLSLSGASAATKKIEPGQAHCSSWFERHKKGYWMCFAGSRITMFDEQNLEANISLEYLPSDTDVVVGPVEGLKGEVTLLHGRPYISFLRDGEQVVENSRDASAIFLGYGGAKDWLAIPVKNSVNTLTELESSIGQVAKENGVDLDSSFPFHIKGQADSLVYHVIYKSDQAPHTKALHQKAKIKFKHADIAFKAAGIWVENDMVGHVTHPDKNAHLHVVVDNGAGHLDEIKVLDNWTLFLPARVNAND